MQGAICNFIGERASEEDVRRNAQQEGFRNVERIEFVNRKYDQAGGCGFYRATAERDGRTWLLVANANDGRITKREAVGQRDDHEQAELDEDQIRQKLRAQGYRDIRDIAYLRRGDDDFYRVIASHGGEVYRLQVSDETGEVLNRSAMGGGRDRNDRDHPNRAEMNPEEISEALNSHGYFRIENLRYVSQRGEDFYVARAWRDNDGLYQLRISDTTGEIENRRRLRAASLTEAELNEAQIRDILSRQGYDVRRLTYRPRGDNDDVYVALATHEGNQYRLRVSDETGQVLSRNQVRGERDRNDRAEMNPEAIGEALRGHGYYRISNLRYMSRRGEDFYVARAWRDDDGLYRLRINDANGEIENRRRLRAASLTEAELNEAQIRDILSRQGYDVRRLTYRPRGDNDDVYVALATHEGNQYRLRVSDETGQVLSRNQVRGERDRNDRAEMNEEEIQQALRRQGYQRIRLRYVTQRDGDWYEVHATLEGVRYEMIVDDEDGEVVRRRVIGRSGEEPREYKRDLNDRAEMNEDQIRQELERQGYRAIRLRYITQSNGDWYETHATLNGVRYEMIVDDEDGRVVRRRRID